MIVEVDDSAADGTHEFLTANKKKTSYKLGRMEDLYKEGNGFTTIAR